MITRGRFIFKGAPKRLETFKYVDGKRNTKEIAVASRRTYVSTLIDLRKMKDCNLVHEKMEGDEIVKKDGCAIFEKAPILNHVPLNYFEDESRGRLKIVKGEKTEKEPRQPKLASMSIPTDKQLLDICKQGESQHYEFKEPGIDTEKITKEIAAFLHTKNGGIIFYGVSDDGSIVGSDKRRQDLDQSIQNSVRSTISPQPNIEIKEIDVLGQAVLAILIPPWNKTLYQYAKDSRYYIRRGCNVFALKPEEISKLAKGKYVI